MLETIMQQLATETGSMGTIMCKQDHNRPRLETLTGSEPTIKLQSAIMYKKQRQILTLIFIEIRHIRPKLINHFLTPSIPSILPKPLIAKDGLVLNNDECSMHCADQNNFYLYICQFNDDQHYNIKEMSQINQAATQTHRGQIRPQVQRIQQKQLDSGKQSEQQNSIKDNDYAIIYESQKYIKLTQIRAGDKFQTTDGAYRHINFINKPWGSKVAAFNKPNQHVNVLYPKSTLITQTLARKTQILYSMDNSAILMKLNVEPGHIVVEAGTGSGSLSCAFSEILGETGRLYTFEFNKQRAQITKNFFQNLNKANITSTWRDVVNDGFRIQGVNFKANALFLDVPNPWAAITHAKEILLKTGKICCFSPCIQQVQKTCDELRRQKFKKIETIECLSRQFEIGNEKQIALQGIDGVKRISSCSRAVNNNRGHTGFLTFAVSC